MHNRLPPYSNYELCIMFCIVTIPPNGNYELCIMNYALIYSASVIFFLSVSTALTIWVICSSETVMTV